MVDGEILVDEFELSRTSTGPSIGGEARRARISAEGWHRFRVRGHVEVGVLELQP